MTENVSQNTTAAETGVICAQSMMVQLTTDGVPKLHCPVCNKALISLSGYVNHVKKHEPPGGFVCRYCSARFCTEESLKRHRDEEHVIIACRICKNSTFTNENEYREHISIVHNGVDREMYNCDKCGAEYKTIDPFRRHMETQCGTVKPHKCDQCPMAFISKYNLKQHKISHSGERKYCCSYCGKDFLQKGRLVEHERSHTGEKPYKCDVCGKSFAHRESIVTHSSIHTGVRLVECKSCQSRFSCYSNLIKHRRARPDTCGLPIYDPPKNRVRSHRSRIPPTLNPTSEIKVSSLNKIIKPEVQIQKSLKKDTNTKRLEDAPAENSLTDVVSRKSLRRTTQKPKKEIDEDPIPIPTSLDNEHKFKQKKRTKLENCASNNSEEDNNFETNMNDLSNVSKVIYSSITSSKTPIKVKTPPLTRIDVKPVWNYSDSDEDFNCYADTVKSDSEEEFITIKKSVPKLSIKEEKPELDNKNNGFDLPDCSDEQEFISMNVDVSINVKSEDDTNIFNQKDKLLDCILNIEDANLEDQEEYISLNTDLKPAKDQLTQSEKSEHVMLQETEVIIVNDANDENDVLNEQDMLDTKNFDSKELSKCKIMLEDIRRHYPELKRENTVKVNRNTRPRRQHKNLVPKSNKPVRKYVKRSEANDAVRIPSSRVAKLNTQELKARLKMLKKLEKSWQCPYCIKIYHMRKPFEKHLREDHQRAEDEIKEVFKTDDIGVNNDEVFKCNICDKIYLVEKRLLAHIKLHGSNGDLIFKCPCYCSFYFATKDEATAHAQREHRDMLFCEICQKFMTGYDSLKNHMKNHHMEKEPRCLKRNLVCDKCGKKFSGRTSLTDHVRSDCGRVPLYPCTICGKHLTTAGILKTHMLLHKEDTPFQCDQCGKTFKVKAQYKTHIKTRHSDAKPYKCHLCPKEYPYRESLLTHMTVHTGIKRFLCQGCGKRFTCISNLQAHRKVLADTCGALPLNAKATQYMGVQKGNLLLGAKPEAGLDYVETNTLIAKNVINKDLPITPELNFATEQSTIELKPVPLNYSQPTPAHMLLPPIVMPQFMDDSHSSNFHCNEIK